MRDYYLSFTGSMSQSPATQLPNPTLNLAHLNLLNSIIVNRDILIFADSVFLFFKDKSLNDFWCLRMFILTLNTLHLYYIIAIKSNSQIA